MNLNSDDKRIMHALGASGKSHSFEVPVAEGLDLILESHEKLSKEGFTDDELRTLILSPTALEEFPHTAETARVIASSVDEFETPADYPPIPTPKNKDDFPPQKSDEVTVSTDDVALFIYFWGKKKGESHGAYYPVEGSVTTPPFPTPAKFAYKRYWSRVGSYKLSGDQGFEKEITTREGMSKTNSTTMSAELGVAVKGLSAKLSKTTTKSITISEERTNTDTYKIYGKEGKITIYTLWQLVEVFVLVDNAGKQIEWRGKWGPPGFKSGIFPAKFPENVFSNNSSIYVSDQVLFDE